MKGSPKFKRNLERVKRNVPITFSWYSDSLNNAEPVRVELTSEILKISVLRIKLWFWAGLVRVELTHSWCFRTSRKSAANNTWRPVICGKCNTADIRRVNRNTGEAGKANKGEAGKENTGEAGKENTGEGGKANMGEAGKEKYGWSRKGKYGWSRKGKYGRSRRGRKK